MSYDAGSYELASTGILNSNYNLCCIDLYTQLLIKKVIMRMEILEVLIMISYLNCLMKM